jgi:hypothetical protein
MNEQVISFATSRCADNFRRSGISLLGYSAVGEAWCNIESGMDDGVDACSLLYRWFTDISGFGLSEQIRRLK